MNNMNMHDGQCACIEKIYAYKITWPVVSEAIRLESKLLGYARLRIRLNLITFLLLNISKAKPCF